MAKKKEFVLLPQPQKLSYRQGAFQVQSSGLILCAGDPSETLLPAQIVREALAFNQEVIWDIRAGDPGNYKSPDVILTLDEGAQFHPQGYQLRVTKKQVQISASTAQGLFYGAITLKQILRQVKNSIPCLQIDDHPDFERRGLMLDVCRDKVPKMETLICLVDELAEMKINHLELYTEHTFAYKNHPAVWAQASPMTGEDIMELDAYCRSKFIELVPNQNSFGHMHRWFDVAKYLPLAECPEGFDAPWGGHWGPFSLAPTNPGSLELIEDLFADLLPHFTSDKFNVGCDETFDLGKGKSKDECEEKGKGRVYLEFLLKIYELVKSHGRTMHFWGDIILQHPELIPELPKDIVALDWGYGTKHPYNKECPMFAKSGIPFYVCPGTSTWSSVAGMTSNALDNIRNAAGNGLKHGAIGLLNTDWGDSGHWQYLPASYLGYAAGAGMSWSFQKNKDRDFIDALDIHVFEDEAKVMGKLAHDLGDTGGSSEDEVNNRTLFYLMQRSLNSGWFRKEFSAADLRATEKKIDRVIAPLSQARMKRMDADLVRDEFLNAMRILTHGCKRGEILSGGKKLTPALARKLDEEMRVIIGEHRRLWCTRNRVGGLHDSAARMEVPLKDYAEALK